MKFETAANTTQASLPANYSIMPAKSALLDHSLDSLAANTKYGDHVTWQMVPLFAQRIVDILHPRGLLPSMNDNVLALALRIMHGEDGSAIIQSVDDFWDEVPELIHVVVWLFTSNHIPILIADCTIALARQLLRDGDSA